MIIKHLNTEAVLLMNAITRNRYLLSASVADGKPTPRGFRRKHLHLVVFDVSISGHRVVVTFDNDILLPCL